MPLCSGFGADQSHLSGGAVRTADPERQGFRPDVDIGKGRPRCRRVRQPAAAGCTRRRETPLPAQSSSKTTSHYCVDKTAARPPHKRWHALVGSFSGVSSLAHVIHRTAATVPASDRPSSAVSYTLRCRRLWWRPPDQGARLNTSACRRPHRRSELRPDAADAPRRRSCSGWAATGPSVDCGALRPRTSPRAR